MSFLSPAWVYYWTFTINSLNSRACPIWVSTNYSLFRLIHFYTIFITKYLSGFISQIQKHHYQFYYHLILLLMQRYTWPTLPARGLILSLTAQKNNHIQMIRLGILSIQIIFMPILKLNKISENQSNGTKIHPSLVV